MIPSISAGHGGNYHTPWCITEKNVFDWSVAMVIPAGNHLENHPEEDCGVLLFKNIKFRYMTPSLVTKLYVHCFHHTPPTSRFTYDPVH